MDSSSSSWTSVNWFLQSRLFLLHFWVIWEITNVWLIPLFCQMCRLVRGSGADLSLGSVSHGYTRMTKLCHIGPACVYMVCTHENFNHRDHSSSFFILITFWKGFPGKISFFLTDQNFLLWWKTWATLVHQAVLVAPFDILIHFPPSSKQIPLVPRCYATNML